MRIPTYMSPEDKEMYRMEEGAYCEDKQFDLLCSMRNRTMTRGSYYRMRHCTRNLLRNLGQLRDGSHPRFRALRSMLI